MKLNEYLKNNKIRMLAFGNKINVSQTMISMICNGIRRPSPDIALRIQEATSGQVTIMELLYPDMPVVSPIAQNVTECRETS